MLKKNYYTDKADNFDGIVPRLGYRIWERHPQLETTAAGPRNPAMPAGFPFPVLFCPPICYYTNARSIMHGTQILFAYEDPITVRLHKSTNDLIDNEAYERYISLPSFPQPPSANPPFSTPSRPTPLTVE